MPVTYFVKADHLNRPIMMTDAAKQVVWQAIYLPFGGDYQITGSASLDARFPGQWFQLESGLAYNWHRHYDASLGRYTQADPLGFPDGPDRYAYAVNSPQMYVDEEGRQAAPAPIPVPMPIPPMAIPGTPENKAWTDWAQDKLNQCLTFFRSTPGRGPGDRCQNACANGAEAMNEFCRASTPPGTPVRAQCWAAANNAGAGNTEECKNFCRANF